MAEFDPMAPKDADEVAYTQALLGDADAGREQRRAKLMSALPRPEVAAAVPVSDNSLAWRWQPYALGLLVTGLLVATALVLKGRHTEPRPESDPRLAAAQPASTAAVVVAQADAKVDALPVPVAEAPRAAAKVSPAMPRAERPVVVADATPPRLQREAEINATSVLSKPVMPPPPAAPVMAAPPPAAAPVMAAALPPPAAVMAAASPKVAADAATQAEVSTRAETVSIGASARARAAPPVAQGLVASDAADPAKTHALLLAAVNRIDLATARSALQAGASVHLRDVKGRTALMLAAQTGSREMVELLLAAGARKTDRDFQGWTAADHAQTQNHEELAERLR